MTDGKRLWTIWQSELREFQSLFTRGGWVRFVDWATGTVLCDEEHTVTQILTSADMKSRWRAVDLSTVRVAALLPQESIARGRGIQDEDSPCGRPRK